MGCLLSVPCRSMSFSFDSQIGKKTVTVDTGISGLSLGEVEHPLEFSVIGVVSLVTLSCQIEVAASLIFVIEVLLSDPKSSHLAFFSAYHPAIRQSPRTPPMYLPDRLRDRPRVLSFSISKELYFSSCRRVIWLGSGMLLGLETCLAKGFSFDITILLSSTQYNSIKDSHKQQYQRRALVLFLVVLPRPIVALPFLT